MSVPWKNETMENAKAVCFWLQNSQAFLELLGTACMHMIPPISCLSFDLSHLALCSQPLEGREEPECL